MAMKKKGIFFTLAAISLSIIILLSFNAYTDYRLKDKMEVIEIRVGTMNNFIVDLENDIDNAIFISGFRSLLSLEEYMMRYDQFFNELGAPTLSVAFSDAFLKGTIDNPSGLPEKVLMMDNNTFINWTTRIKEQANKTDISLDFTVNSVTITQTEPWKVDITVNLDINVQDNKNTASWTIDGKTYTKKINITTETSTKFVDPLYLVYNDGLVNNTIRPIIVADFSSISNLQTHLDSSYYIENTDSPSYLNRFEADKKFTASTYGIESLVNLPALEAEGILTFSKSAVDHIYFDSTSTTTDCNIDGMGMTYDWFYLDHLPLPNHKDSSYGGFNCAP